MKFNEAHSARAKSETGPESDAANDGPWTVASANAAFCRLLYSGPAVESGDHLLGRDHQ